MCKYWLIGREKAFHKTTWEPKRFKYLSAIPSKDTKNPHGVHQTLELPQFYTAISTNQTHPKLPTARQAWGEVNILGTKIS